MLKAIKRLIWGSDAERLKGARSELRRVENDLETLGSMLSAQRDSFHNALAESTAHQVHLRERRTELKTLIRDLEERLTSR